MPALSLKAKYCSLEDGKFLSIYNRLMIWKSPGHLRSIPLSRASFQGLYDQDSSTAPINPKIVITIHVSI
jgi:hypothetical protein